MDIGHNPMPISCSSIVKRNKNLRFFDIVRNNTAQLWTSKFNVSPLHSLYGHVHYYIH